MPGDPAAAEDARLIHELLQSNLKSRRAIDHDRVVSSGGSQGTCFLANFVEFYGGSYGGGPARQRCVPSTPYMLRRYSPPTRYSASEI